MDVMDPYLEGKESICSPHAIKLRSYRAKYNRGKQQTEKDTKIIEDTFKRNARKIQATQKEIFSVLGKEPFGFGAECVLLDHNYPGFCFKNSMARLATAVPDAPRLTSPFTQEEQKPKWNIKSSKNSTQNTYKPLSTRKHDLTAPTSLITKKKKWPVRPLNETTENLNMADTITTLVEEMSFNKDPKKNIQTTTPVIPVMKFSKGFPKHAANDLRGNKMNRHLKIVPLSILPTH